MITNISIPVDELAALCGRYHVRRLSLFGSVLRDDFGPESDVDVLVEFEPGATVTYLDLAEMQLELSALLERPIDIGTPASLSPYIRDHVLESAEIIYEY